MGRCAYANDKRCHGRAPPIGTKHPQHFATPVPNHRFQSARMQRMTESTDAEAQLRAQLQTDPAHHTSTLVLAGLQLSDGRVSEAIALLWLHADDRDCGDVLREYFLGERMNDHAQSLLAQRGSDPSASGLVDRAIGSHLRGDLDGAITCCRLALTADAGYAPAHNHLGRALFNARRTEPARAALVQAVRIAPNYAEAWHNLAHVLRDAHELEQAERAYGHALRLRPAYRSARLNLGIVQMASGRPNDALESFQSLLAIDPDHAEALYNLGLCEHLLRHYDAAASAFQRAIALDPRNPQVHLHYGRLCNERLDTEGALRQFRHALDIDPRDPEPWAEIAKVHEQANRLDDAERAVAAGLAAAPNDGGLRLEQAKIARRKGNVGVALADLRRIDLRSLHPRLHQQYHYELGWALDRAGEHAAAMPEFERGNALAARSPRAQTTDAQAFDRRLDAIDGWLQTGAPTADMQPAEDTGEDLCFLFSFPRSGTTLLDVMLDGHPDVASIEEQSTIERLVQTITEMPGGYPGALATIDRADCDALRRDYREIVASLLGHRAQGAKLIVDKMPIRSVHAAFIQRLFPRARLLFSLRHPCDVVLSNTMQQYAANEVYVHFYSLAESVRIYDRVMRVWETTLRTLPLRTEYVRYEDLIGDTEHALRDACAFLDLPWRDDLVEHRKHLQTRQRISTNSYHQVAEPIYTRSVGRWHGYRDALAPFMLVLKQHIEYFDYAPD